jgi:hypothetical protein
MKAQNRKELISFNKSLKAETNEAYKAYIEAQKVYQKTLKNFIIRNVTGKKYFKEMYGYAFSNARECYSYDCQWIVDELITLDWMISDYQYYLEDLEEDQA